MNNGKAVIAVLAGVAAGAALGVLFAPDKGTDTREKIVDKKDDIIDSFNEKMNSFFATLADKFEQVKEGASELAERGKTKLENVQKEAKEAKEHVEKGVKAAQG